MLLYPGSCSNNRALASWMAAEPIAQQMHLLESLELLIAPGYGQCWVLRDRQSTQAAAVVHCHRSRSTLTVLPGSLEEGLAQKPEAVQHHHNRPDQSTPVGPGTASLGVLAQLRPCRFSSSALRSRSNEELPPAIILTGCSLHFLVSFLCFNGAKNFR